MKEVTKHSKRKFIIGSEWLSYKLYMGTQTADTFIKTQLIQIINDLTSKNCINDWFFIRYADPDLHLRLRFHVPNTNQIGEITSRLYESVEPLLNDRLIHKVQVDTYSRELERYGHQTIEESEKLFCINSQMIIQVLRATNDNENSRWLLGMKAIDILLNAFDYSLLEKRDLLFEMKTDFANEFGINKNIRKQLSMKFRNSRKEISTLLDPEAENETYNMLSKYGEEYKKIFKGIISKERPLNTKVNKNYLMYSYLHMHCNRLFPAKQRMNEWVLYDLLYQYYYSHYARFKANQKSIAIVA
ncbi:thiopeptide-type bacteriocin biosynthesis protein [Aquimarina pacifica]|uniref:thiopeptide-type bacteriocin biosynthesis protein n=1 Tax=Aquimarina pacifica TaxID=1296415 RepID=UPI000471731D|nr:thiopeptide-type bacteriocin biosynthesis protein [Aquimarina pacifica]